MTQNAKDYMYVFDVEIGGINNVTQITDEKHKKKFQLFFGLKVDLLSGQGHFRNNNLCDRKM
jgi:hypothetical protein